MSRIVLNKTSFFSALRGVELDDDDKGIDSDCAGPDRSNGDVTALYAQRLPWASSGPVLRYNNRLHTHIVRTGHCLCCSRGQACPVAPITAAFNLCLNREPSSSNESDVRVGDSDCVISGGALSDWVRACVFCVETAGEAGTAFAIEAGGSGSGLCK